MKSEFLKNFQVNGQPLPQEVMDAILSENQRDLTEAVKPFADYEAIKEQLKTATDGLKAFDGVDVADLKGQVEKLKGDLAEQAKNHANQLADLQFHSTLKEAITAAKGRSAKAITALLDVDALKVSKNQAADIQTALEGLKKESAYLFEQTAPPPYAAGTGSATMNPYAASGIAAFRAAAGLNK